MLKLVGVVVCACVRGQCTTSHAHGHKSCTACGYFTQQQPHQAAAHHQASRDSIAPVVKETFGDGVDKFRHVEGRLETFMSAWPHTGHVRLNAERMAKCGFLFAPDALAPDKVLCAYCGLELAHWEDHDDPHTAHNDNSPGQAGHRVVRWLDRLYRKHPVAIDRVDARRVLLLAQVEHFRAAAQP